MPDSEGRFFLCGDRWALAAGPGDQLLCGMGRLCLRVYSSRLLPRRSLSAGRLQGYLFKFILHVHENPNMILTLVNFHSGMVDGGTRACSVPVTVKPRVSKRFPR